MFTRVNLQNNAVVFGVPLLMMLSLVLLVKSSFFTGTISSLIIIDFLIIIPLSYFLLIRKRNITKASTITVAIIGLLIASNILPEENQGVLVKVKTVLLPLGELFLIGYILFKSKQAIKRYKTSKNKTSDVFDSIKQVCNEILPYQIGNILATEIAVVYYGFLNWKKRELQENEFSYHKNSTAVSVILGFLLVVVVELFVTHTMMKQGNVNGSFVLATLSIYTALQIIAILLSLAKRPIYIDETNKQLILRFGIIANGTIPFNKIEDVLLTTAEIPEQSTIKYFSPLGSSSGHNIVLHFKEEIKFNSFYGLSKKANSLAIYVDEKNKFKEALKLND